jgi:ribonuclease HI
MTAVTIVSDASHCPRTNAAGYGFWAVSSRGRHAGGGSFKTPLTGSDAAEVMAVVNALHVTLSLGIAEKGDHVLVQTDCLYAIHVFTGVVLKIRNAEVKRAREVFANLVLAHALKMDFRHVRGHTDVQDRRSLAQRHADKRAKKAMKDARAKVSA